MAKLVLLEGMLSSPSSDSDSDESIDLGSWDDIFEDDDGNHHCYPLRPIPTVYNFMENVVARYTDTEFQENFRLKRTTFYYLLNILKADMSDKAYTLQKHLMTPFIDNGHLTVEETHYNYVHSSTRMTIERAIDEILLPDEVDDVGALDAINESKAAGAAKRENLVTILNRDVEP
ncbi:hypothetical protein PV326_011614 [Microctonus aethiopoides]|nr:hypothetical protein PV326_011614 [Microctonus aethiopoides]